MQTGQTFNKPVTRLSGTVRDFRVYCLCISAELQLMSNGTYMRMQGGSEELCFKVN